MLHKIVEHKKEEIVELKRNRSIKSLKDEIDKAPSPRSLLTSIRNSSREVAVIAEVKKASPSKGVIREDFSPLEIALEYNKAEVDGISVLTDQHFFQGKNEYLREIRNQVQCPVLRKDFIIDPIQIYEARALGADCVLLIAAILSADQLVEFHHIAKNCSLDTLIEVHTGDELRTVLENIKEPDLLGINNRDLKTFQTTLDTTRSMIENIPEGITVISESGISSPDHIVELKEMGARGVLVGEHFMRQGDIEGAVYQLVGKRSQTV